MYGCAINRSTVVNENSLPPPGFKSVSMREDLYRKVEEFVESNDEGYGNPAEVVAAAVREFLRNHRPQPPI